MIVSSYLKLFCISLLTWLFFSSCQKRDWVLLGERDIRQILTDYTVLSAALSTRGEDDSVRHLSYRAFFEQKGYRISDWDSSMMWYAKTNLPLYYDFYRLASEQLSRHVDELQIKQDSISKREDYERNRRNAVLDSINLLNVAPKYYLAGELVNSTFSIRPISPYQNKKGTLSINISGLPKLCKCQAWDFALKFHQQDSSVRINRMKINAPGVYHLDLETSDDNKSTVRISGYLRGIVPPLNNSEFVWIDSLRFVRSDIEDKSKINL